MCRNCASLSGARKATWFAMWPLPYQDPHIMDACLECGANYLDTANYEPLDTAKFGIQMAGPMMTDSGKPGHGPARFRALILALPMFSRPEW